MTLRYAYIVQGKTLWGPGANPYYITLENGDIWEISAHTIEESEAVGVFVVEQVGMKDNDNRFFAANLPVYSVVNGKPKETWSYSFIPSALENMLNAVDEHAENVRQYVSTKYPGQYAEYDEVYKEAVEVQALPVDQVIPSGEYPYLDADLNVTYSEGLGRPVQTVREAADLVIQTRDSWKNEGAFIRSNRLRIKKLLREAPTVEDAYQIYLDEVVNAE